MRKAKEYPKIEALPCPFCKSTAGFVERADICVYQYFCDCGAKGPPVEHGKYADGDGDPEGDATKAWNRRKWQPRQKRAKKIAA